MQVTGLLDDLQGQIDGSLGPGDQPAGVAAVCPGQRNGGKRAAQVPEQRLCGVAVLDGRGGDQHRQEQAACVHGDVALAAVDLLPRVMAPAGARTISEPFTDCESMIAAVGAVFRPAAARTRPRRSLCIRSAEPSACHLSAQ
jgi:hypothetical protein